MRAYMLLDVFCKAIFSGSPVAVIPDSRGLDEADMQAIAVTMRRATTVFILPDAPHGCDAACRIFTPGCELSFAGTAIMALSAFMAFDQGLASAETKTFTFATPDGLTRATVTADTKGELFIKIVMPRRARKINVSLPVGMLLTAVGLSVKDLADNGHEPTVYDTSQPYYYLPVRDLGSLSRIAADITFMRRMFTLSGHPHAAIFAYTLGGTDGGDMRARMFLPSMGLVEDPASGVAMLGLCDILQQREPIRDGERRFVVEQGYEIGRPSLISVQCTLKDSAVAQVQLAGRAIVIADGELF